MDWYVEAFDKTFFLEIYSPVLFLQVGNLATRPFSNCVSDTVIGCVYRDSAASVLGWRHWWRRLGEDSSPISNMLSRLLLSPFTLSLMVPVSNIGAHWEQRQRSPSRRGETRTSRHSPGFCYTRTKLMADKLVTDMRRNASSMSDHICVYSHFALFELFLGRLPSYSDALCTKLYVQWSGVGLKRIFKVGTTSSDESRVFATLRKKKSFSKQNNRSKDVLFVLALVFNFCSRCLGNRDLELLHLPDFAPPDDKGFEVNVFFF